MSITKKTTAGWAVWSALFSTAQPGDRVVMRKGADGWAITGRAS